MKKFVLALLMLSFGNCAFGIEEAYEEPIILEEENSAPTFFSSLKKNYIYTLDNYAETASSMGINIDSVSRRDIERENTPSLSSMLQQVGSVYVGNTNGSDGSVTTMRIRGTDRVRATLDGIRIDRPSLTSSTVELQNFNLDDIEAFEVIKGPQGNVLGTNASGGALNMMTRRGEGKFKLELGSDFGNIGTFKERIAAMGGNEKADFYLSTTYYKTDGGMRTKYAGRLYNDGYKNLNIVSNNGLRLLDNKAEIRNVFRSSTSRKYLGLGYGSKWDPLTYSSINYFYNEPNAYADNLDITDSLTFKHEVNEKYNYMARIGIYHNTYTFHDDPDNLNYDVNYWDVNKLRSNRLNMMTQHNYKITDWNTLSLGYNFENEHVNIHDKSYSTPSMWGGGISEYGAKGSTIQNDVYVNDVVNINDILFLRGGARFSTNNQYGEHIMPNGSGALVLPTFKIAGAKTKFRGSWGQSINNPTLYQRYVRIPSYNVVPNPDLSPEKLQSWDAGIEQSFYDEKLKFEIGYFDSRYKDYIAYFDGWSVYPTTNSYYKNIDSAKLKGYEGKFTFEPNEKFKFVINYTYTDSKDDSTGKDLVGTPKNMLNGTLYYTPAERFTIYAGVQSTSSLYSGSDTVKAKGGVDARIGASLRLFSIKDTHFYLKSNIYNLFNQKISYYRTNYDELYTPRLRYNIGIFIEYNPDKIIKRREKKKESV